jgi:membrane protease YdiL (CAAX protease family)
MPWDFALILGVLGVLVPWRGAIRIRQLLRAPRLSTEDRLAVYATTSAFQWLAAGIVAWRSHARGVGWEELGLGSVRVAPVAAAALALTAVLVATQLLSLRRLARLPAEKQGLLGEIARRLLPQNQLEALAFVALAGTVGICEEFLYRGFAFAALARATENLWAAAAVSSALFALAHLYQGRRGVGVTFVVGLVFAGVRVGTSSLAPTMLAHLTADLVAGLFAPRWLRVPAEPGPTSVDDAGPEGP